MLERELHVPGEVARGVATDEVACFEDGESAVDVVDVGEGVDDATPEDLADDGSGQESGPSVLGERVDPGGDRLAHRHWQVAARSTLDDRCRELLEEQRVPAGGLDDPCEAQLRVPVRMPIAW